jgi:hypothetical protein
MRRMGAAFLALVQFAVAGFVPVADATLEDVASREPIHVEAPSDGACETHHDHLFCQLCRVLTLSGASAPVPGVPAAAPAASVATAWAGAPLPFDDAGQFGALGSRAPPLA